MIKRKLSIRKITIYLILPLLILFFLLLWFYFFMLSPVSKKSEEVLFEVKSGETYSSISDKLKENNLIRSTLFFKLYIKLNNIDYLEAGKYKLNKNMNIADIVKMFHEGSSYNPDAINVTIPEGKNISEIAEIISKKTLVDKNIYLTAWNSNTFIDNVIDKYWFITEDIKNKDIRYGLEGYFFPSTYELLNKDVSAEYIAYKFLDQMETVLNKYKEKIENSDYSVHEILTLASIVEYEAKFDEDRPIIAGVFYNRLDADWKLQSDVTVWYAIGEKKLSYTYDDLNTDSPYNTYYYAGLPVGPVNNPSEASLNGVLNPVESDYYYFIADICSEDNKTYYAKSYSEHIKNVEKYLTCD